MSQDSLHRLTFRLLAEKSYFYMSSAMSFKLVHSTISITDTAGTSNEIKLLFNDWFKPIARCIQFKLNLKQNCYFWGEK